MDWFLYGRDVRQERLKQEIRPVETGGGAAGGLQTLQNFAKFYFYELKKIVLKRKIVQSTKIS